MNEQKVDSEKVERLYNQLQAFKLSFWKLYRRSGRISNSLVAASLLLGACVTLAGFLGYAMLAGVAGVVITVLIGFQNAYNFAERAEFYLLVHEEAKVLRDRVQYKVSTIEDFEKVVDALGQLRVHAAKNLPKGKGMEAAKEIYSSTQK